MKFIHCLTMAFAFLFITSNSTAQELTFYRGALGMSYYKDDHQISKKQFLYLIHKDPVASQQWKKANRNGAISYGFLAAQIGFSGWYLAESIAIIEGRRPSLASRTAPALGMLASAAGSMVFTIKRANAQRNATLAYNKSLDISFPEPRITPHSIGMAVQVSF